MANVVTAMVGEGVRQVTTFRSIGELLQNCGTSLQANSDSLSPSSYLGQSYGPLTCQGVSGVLSNGVVNAVARPVGCPQKVQAQLFPTPISLGLGVEDCVGSTMHQQPRVADTEAVPTSVASRCSPRSDYLQCECPEEDMTTSTGMCQTVAKQGGKSSFGDVSTVSEQLLEEGPMVEGRIDLASCEQTTIMGRAATTTTSSSVSALDTARPDEAGRFCGGVPDFEVSERFPSVPSTFMKSMYDVVERSGGPTALDVDCGQALKQAEGHCEVGGISSQAGLQGSGEMPSGANSGGLWPLDALATSNIGNADFIMQCFLRAIRAESSSIPSGVPQWGGGRRAVLEASLADVGARSDGSTGDESARQHLIHDQLFALRGAAGPATALQLLQAAATTRLPGMAPCDGQLGGGSQLCGQREGQFMMPSLCDHGVFGQSGMVADNLPHMAGGQFSVPADFNSRMSLSSPTELLRTRGLLDMESAVPRITDLDSFLRSSQLQSLCSAPGAKYHGDFKGPLFTGLPQPPEFPVTRHIGGTSSDVSWLLPFSPDALGFSRSHVVSDGTLKKGRKGLGLSHDGKQKKIRKTKVGSEAQPESSTPESPKHASRKKREVSRKSSNGNSSDISSGLTSNRVAIVNGFANFTEEDVAEAEAEAFLRQSNRSRNSPPEVITAVDFSGAPITFTKVIGLHYHPKQNRWLAWRSQKGSKKVFKSFSTKKFGISGARLMALRWRLGHGIQTEDAQDGVSDSGAEEQTQSPSGDDPVQLPLNAALGCDELSDSTATGGRGSSESSTPSNVRGQLSETATGTMETVPVPVKVEEIGSREKPTQSPSASPIYSPVHEEQRGDVRHDGVLSNDSSVEDLVGLECYPEVPSDPSSHLEESLEASDEGDRTSAFMSDRLKLLLGSVIPAEGALE